MLQSINERILKKKREILKKQKEIESLKQDILSLEVLKQEMRIPDFALEEEYFIVPKRILESYFKSML